MYWNRRRGLAALCSLVLLVSATLAVAAQADPDRHEGYYYPPVISSEVYKARAVPLADASRSTRIQFVVNLTQQILARPHAPEYAVFAKGDEAEKLIIVGLKPGSLSTVYRARAVLAMLTSVARASRLFNEFGVQEYFTFFDLAKLFGFEKITISDGDKFTHQIILQ